MTADDPIHRARFAAARVARLATADADAVPHVVPVTFAVVGDTIVIAIDTKPKSGRPLKRLANITANPAVSVLADHYDDADWTRLWWVRADGAARVVDNREEREHDLDALREKYGQYRSDFVATDGPVIAIEVVRWSGWAFSRG